MATHPNLTPRLERVELYLHSPTCLHGVYNEVNLTFTKKKKVYTYYICANTQCQNLALIDTNDGFTHTMPCLCRSHAVR
jgi:hypothetical protein